MGSLKFVCSKHATSDADFRIEYYNPKNWNDYGYFTRYRLFAESSITGGGEILVGTIKISSIGQQQGIEDHLSSVMGETPFEKIDDTFYSEIFEENVARKVMRFLIMKFSKRHEHSLLLVAGCFGLIVHAIILERSITVSRNTS